MTEAEENTGLPLILEEGFLPRFPLKLRSRGLFKHGAPLIFALGLQFPGRSSFVLSGMGRFLFLGFQLSHSGQEKAPLPPAEAREEGPTWLERAGRPEQEQDD